MRRCPYYFNVLDAKIIIRLKEGYHCGDRCKFGEGEFAIAPAGNIDPCERVVGEDNGGELCLGNVLTGIDAETQLRMLTRRGNQDPECKACELAARCMNWCGCINYGTTGNIDSTGELYEEANPLFIQRFYGDE